MIQQQEKKKNADGEDESGELHDDDDNDDTDSTTKKEEDVLDMPPPWSPKLFVNKDKFLDLCPNGEKTVFYKKCKVDFYSECS